TYPKKVIKQVNAGIGGTGSSLGVYRINEQVLKYNPDLVFIEFATNDYKETRKSILESMEGMVRQVWQQCPNTDICFIYTFTMDMIENYQKGFAPYSILTMEELANHYQIPSINFAPDILKRLNDKKLFPMGNHSSRKDSLFFSGDGVHPYPETGHKYYAETMSKSLTTLLQFPKRKKHKLRTVYFSDALVNARMLDVDDKLGISVNAHPLAQKLFNNLLPDIKLLKNDQEQIQFTFTGNKIGFLDVIGPFSTQLKVEVDNDSPRYITRFDKFCSFTRMHWFFIENLGEGQHNIKISIWPNQINKFKILDKNLSELKNIEDYKEEYWQLGKILLVNNI
ncbi:MAG TPA: SGNH/GDSL hydrolase family protein, partial [Arachidicoccus soli]|nr:SGNH/GDSL hydrolase family protein [Arachidicoccus soli]